MSCFLHQEVAAIDKGRAADFLKKYGRVHISRDSGLGVGGGKIQRDALCTRGRQGNAPFSNRNLRWHPLVVAEQEIPYATPVEEVLVDSEGERAALTFVVRENGAKKKYSSEDAHKLKSRYVVLPEHWLPHIDTLRLWGSVQWTSNSCVISAQESCDAEVAAATYGFLGCAIAVALYNVNFDTALNGLSAILDEQGIAVALPAEENEYVLCPMCQKGINDGLDEFRKEPRSGTWQPSWRMSKKSEGDDSSMQILHVNPLIEGEMRHRVGNVRFGHRWCNIAMSDHSMDETLDFMSYIVKTHRGGK